MRHPKLMMFALAVLTLLIVAPYPISPLLILRTVHAANVNMSLIGDSRGWNYSQSSGTNPTITVKNTDNVLINLTSTDTRHRFWLDANKNGILDCGTFDVCSFDFTPTSSSQAGWVAGFLPTGNYTYYCVYHTVSMQGTIRVIAGPSDFTLFVNPSMFTIFAPGSQTSSISVRSLNNFTGTVHFTATPPTGLITTFNPQSISPPKNDYAFLTLNVTVTANALPGSNSFEITATNGTAGPVHLYTVTVQVNSPDFTITPSTNSVILVRGNSATATITLTSTNGFTGLVSLKDQISPTGPTTSQNPRSVNLASGGSQTSTITVSTSTTTPPGDYTITIMGNATVPNRQLIHSQTITLRVATANGYPLLPVLIGGVVGAIAIIVLLIALARRRQTKQ